MRPTMTLTAALPALLTVLLVPAAVQADDEPAHHLGDHPAVVVQRLQKSAGYDYASKFYPHPAWLYLYAQQPLDESDLKMMASAQNNRVTDATARRHGTGAPPR